MTPRRVVPCRDCGKPIVVPRRFASWGARQSFCESCFCDPYDRDKIEFRLGGILAERENERHGKYRGGER